MAELLSAEKVMEREKQRFQERYERAQKEADEAKAQVEKLEQALRILHDRSSPAKGE
jgi:sugar-specific transcriptional regulator TrmB